MSTTTSNVAEKNAPEGMKVGAELLTPLEAVGILGFGVYLADFYMMMAGRISPASSLAQASTNSLILVFCSARHAPPRFSASLRSA